MSTFDEPTVQVNLPLFQGPPVYTDVIQGNFGSCWLLSTLVSYLRPGPKLDERQQDIIRSVSPLVNQEYKVKLGKKHYIVDNTMPTRYINNRQRVMWPILFEKAFMAADPFNKHNLVEVEPDVFRALKLKPSSIEVMPACKSMRTMLPSNSSQMDIHSTGPIGIWPKLRKDILYRMFREGRHIIALTSGKTYLSKVSLKEANGVPNHAYAIIDVEKRGASDIFITVYNPWGYNPILKGKDNGTSVLSWDHFVCLFCCIQYG